MTTASVADQALAHMLAAFSACAFYCAGCGIAASRAFPFPRSKVGGTGAHDCEGLRVYTRICVYTIIYTHGDIGRTSANVIDCYMRVGCAYVHPMSSASFRYGKSLYIPTGYAAT
eukprot:6200908-Pleurochrysis_carterae.AAC.3